MSELNVKVTDEQLGGIMSEAILKALDTPTREALIRDAIKFLVAPKESYGFGRNMPSPIQDAFYRACQDVARVLANEMLTANAEFRDRVQHLVAEATVKVFEDDRVKTVETIATAMVSALRPKSDY